MERRIKFILILACLFNILNFQAADAKDQLKIGVLFPFTGDLARLGIDSYNGAELARVVQNEKGGLFGKEIVYVRADAIEPKIAVTEAERLITRENVDIIIGSYSSSLSYAATEVSEKYEKIYWEQGAIADKITERGFKYLFRTVPKASLYMDWAAQVTSEGVCNKLGIKPANAKIVAIFEDSLMGSTMAENVKEKLKKYGLKVLRTEFYNRKAIDLSPMILRLKEMEPDILLGSNYITDLILFWRQCKEADFNVKAFIGLGGGASMNDFYHALGNDVNYVMETAFCPPSDAVNPQYAPGVADLMKKYKKVFGHTVSSVYPSVNYMSTMTLWEVIKRARSTNPKAIRKAAMEIDIPDNTTVTGWGAKFNAEGQNIRARVITQQWQEGKLWAVWPAAAAVPGKEMKLPMPTWKERR